MDTAHWPQGIGVVRPPVENPPQLEKKPRPQKEQALNCPRCNSTNTKFCYYNNYSLSQPRYFCKTCKRYWTEGGTLRNVPVGGGSRKHKRSSSSSSSSISSKKLVIPDIMNPPKFSSKNPKIHDGQDLDLAYNNPPMYNGITELVGLPFANLNHQNPNYNSSTSCSSNFPVNISSWGLNSLLSMPVSNSNSVFSSSSFQPSLSFSLDNNGYGNLQPVQDQATPSSRTLFPFEELKPSDQFDDQQVKTGQQAGDSNGYWINGMLSGDMNLWR